MSRIESVDSELVHVNYHQLQIVDRDVVDDAGPLSWADNGLVSVRKPGLATVACGVHTGYVSVKVEVHETEPPVTADEWDDAVEVSIVAPYGQLRIVGLMSNLSTGLPVVSPHGPGDYRLRIY